MKLRALGHPVALFAVPGWVMLWVAFGAGGTVLPVHRRYEVATYGNHTKAVSPAIWWTGAVLEPLALLCGAIVLLWVIVLRFQVPKAEPGTAEARVHRVCAVLVVMPYMLYLVAVVLHFVSLAFEGGK